MKSGLSKESRNSSFELLRIISMILIVVSHYSVHGSIKGINLSFGLNKIILDASDFGPLGVGLFVMISGYFLITKPFKIDRILRVVLDTMFYSVLFFIIFSIINHKFSVASMIKAIFPIVPMQYWFVTAYVFMMLLSPFLNKLINNFTEHEFKVYLFVMLLIVSISSMIPKFNSFEYFGFLGQFILFYSLGAFLKIYPKALLRFNKPKNYLLVSLLLLLLLVLSSITIDLLSNYFSIFAGKYSFLYGRGSIVVIAIAFTMFQYFINKEPFENRFINAVSSCAFGVYLIHDNNYMREYLWNSLFNNSKYAESNALILHFLLSVVIVYVVCTLIEYFRINFINKYLLKKVNSKIINFCNAILKNLI